MNIKLLINKRKLLLILSAIALLFNINNVFSNSNTDDNNNKKQTLLLQKNNNKLAPLDYFTKDTLINNNQLILDNEKPGEPSRYIYSPFQDTVYNRAIRLTIPISVRLDNDYQLFEKKRQLERELENNLPWQIALENLNFDPDILKPSPQELVQREVMIRRSLYVPFVPILMNKGLSINLQDIGRFFGLTEDVSPVLNFKTERTEEVEIVIYSIQAVAIARIYKGILFPGAHTITWNGRDDKGRPMPSGDYIGEIRIGTVRYYRKRITLP